MASPGTPFYEWERNQAAKVGDQRGGAKWEGREHFVFSAQDGEVWMSRCHCGWWRTTDSAGEAFAIAGEHIG